MEAHFSAHPQDPEAVRPVLKVLVAEDIAVNRELIRLFLEKRGHSVEMVDDGDRAVAAVQADLYDIVIMDMQMPTMDGLEATRAIRALGGRFASLPVLGLSANVVPEQVARCLASGMSAHLGKPFTSEGLGSAVETAYGAARTSPPAGPVAKESRSTQLPWAQKRTLYDLLMTQIQTFEDEKHADGPMLARQAHALCGGAGVMGFAGLADACRALERACAGADWMTELVTTLRSARNVKRVIRDEIARGG